ncbi:hypothetical protein D3C75_1110080 [compost metagenome]
MHFATRKNFYDLLCCGSACVVVVHANDDLLELIKELILLLNLFVYAAFTTCTRYNCHRVKRLVLLGVTEHLICSQSVVLAATDEDSMGKGFEPDLAEQITIAASFTEGVYKVFRVLPDAVSA